MDSDVESLLRDYLKKEESDPIRKRLEGIANWQMTHDKQDDTRHNEVMRTLDGHNYRITGLEVKASKIEEEVEDTKTHDLRTIRNDNGIRDLLMKAFLGILLVLAGVGVHAAIQDMAQGKPVPTAAIPH